MALELAFKECGPKVKGFRVVGKGKKLCKRDLRGVIQLLLRKSGLVTVGKEVHCPRASGWFLASLRSCQFYLQEMGALGGASVRLIAGK